MAKDKKPKVLAIVGPTGSGKTALSLKLAETMPLCVVACDSRTIYCEMDIGTAKPTNEEQSHTRHYMLDVVSPTETYTVAQYRLTAKNAIDEVLGLNSLPAVVGGTGFYARALLEGLVIPEVEPQIELRRELNAFADQFGNLALWQRLEKTDSISAQKINFNDRFRVVRALEVSSVLNKPFSKAAYKTDPEYDVIWIGLNAEERSFLYKKIEERFAQQLKEGMIEEVENLLSRYGETMTIKNTVNYREIARYLQGKISRDEAVEEAIKANCHLARKQLIWFRANEKMKWFNIETSKEKLFQDVQLYVESQLSL